MRKLTNLFLISSGLKQIFTMLTFLIIIFSLTACSGKADTAVSDLEKCLGTVKTKKTFDDLTKEQQIAIANCMLAHNEPVKQKFEKMSPEEQGKFEKDLKAAIEKSEYKEILSELNYETLKDMTNEKVNSSADKSISDISTPSLDGMTAAREMCDCADKHVGDQAALEICQKDWEEKWSPKMKSMSEKDSITFIKVVRENATQCVQNAAKSIGK